MFQNVLHMAATRIDIEPVGEEEDVEEERLEEKA